MSLTTARRARLNFHHRAREEKKDFLLTRFDNPISVGIGIEHSVRSRTYLPILLCCFRMSLYFYSHFYVARMLNRFLLFRYNRTHH